MFSSPLQPTWVLTIIGEEESISYKDVETSPYQTYFKNVRLMAINNESNQTIFVSDELVLLHKYMYIYIYTHAYAR